MPQMRSSLVVGQQGARVHRINERIQVRDERGRVLRDLPRFHVGTIVLMGCVEITNATLSSCFRDGIDVVFLTEKGRFKGRLGTSNLSDSRLRLAQYVVQHDRERSLDLARRMVTAKVESGRVLLRRRRGGSGPELLGAIERMTVATRQISRCPNLDALRGHEGTAARVFFSGMRRCLKQDLGFERRVRRPPTDPVNALLSFGYTMLCGEVVAAVKRQGLDPYLGHLHVPENNRPSLVLDLMEEFRPVVVDTLVLALVNRVQFTARDFVETEDRGVSMAERALPRFIRAFHQRLSDPIHMPSGDRSVPLREGIVLQSSHYKDVILERAGAYQPVKLR